MKSIDLITSHEVDRPDHIDLFPAHLYRGTFPRLTALDSPVLRIAGALFGASIDWDFNVEQMYYTEFEAFA